MKIIALSRYHPLDDNELWEAEQTIDVLALAVKIRVETLASNFRNQNLDPVIEFQHAYNGMVCSDYSLVGHSLHPNSSRLFGARSMGPVRWHSLNISSVY